MQSAIDKIRELRALHEDGLLSRHEFDQRKNAILLEHCANEGRDPAEIERTWGVDDVEAAEALAEVGVQHVIVGIGGDGDSYDLSALRELVKWRDARNA